MTSKTVATTALLISLNLLFFTMVSSTYCPPPPPKKVKPCCGSTPPTPKHPSPSPKHPPPTPKYPPTTRPTCPTDTLKLGVCANVLSGLLNIVIGTPYSKTECCSLISGLADLDAAICLCTAIKANILGINLNVPISLSLLLNYCGKNYPYGYQCA